MLTKNLFNVMKNVYVSSHHSSETFASPKAGCEWVHLNQINILVFRKQTIVVSRVPINYTCGDARHYYFGLVKNCLFLLWIFWAMRNKHKKFSRNFSISKTGGHNDEKLFKRGKSSNLYPLYQTLILVRRIFKFFAFLCDMKFSRGSLIFGNNNIADYKKCLKFKSAKMVVREQ